MRRKFNLKLISKIMILFMFLSMLMVVAPLTARAVGLTYYVDPAGNDSLDGRTPSTAWATLAKVNSVVFQPGDKILFKSGGIWSGYLKPQGAGVSGSPIIIDMYGGTVKPIINGSGVVRRSYLYQDIATVNVVANTTYTFSAWGMLDVANGIGKVYVRETYGAGSTIDHVIADFTTNSWIQKSTTFITQPNVTNLTAYVEKVDSPTSTSFFLVDDISLKYGTTETIQDPDFELLSQFNMSKWKFNDAWAYIDCSVLYGLGYRIFAPHSGIVCGLVGISNTVELKNQQYWEINNLEITNNTAANQGLRNGIYVSMDNGSDSNHIYFKNLDVHNINGMQDDYDSTGGINVFAGGNTTQTRYNDLLIENCNVHDLPYANIGILLSSNWSDRQLGYWYLSTGVKVRNNTVRNIACQGIFVSGASAPVVEYNVGDSCSQNHNVGVGIWQAYTDNAIFQYNESYNMKAILHTGDIDSVGFNAGGMSTNSIYQYNYSHNNEGGFILIDDSGRYPYTNDNPVVRYNISQNDQHKLIELTTAAPLNSKIYNNTFYIGAGLIDPPKKVLTSSYYDSTITNPAMAYFYNNIFYDNGSSGWAWGTMPAANRVFDYNCFYGGIGNPGQTHPITSDPLFAGVPPAANGRSAAYNVYKLQATSPCIDAGARIGTDVLVGHSNGGVDFWGNSLYYGAGADIGASEYVGDIIVDFESRGTADQALTGTYGSIDWGTSDWRTTYVAGYTVFLYANNTSTAEITRTFTLPAGKVLKSLKIAGGAAISTVKVSQPGNTEITWTNIPATYQTYNTGWTSATGGTVTVKITCSDPTYGASGIFFDDIVYGTGSGGSTKLTVSSASASSTFPAWVASLAIDGLITPPDSTSWSASSAAQPQWLKLDLGSTKTVNKTNIAWYNPTVSIYTYNIQVSTDDITYTTVVPSKNSTSSTWLADTFANTSTRYVKINITASTYDYDCITEAEVYGN